MVYHQYPEGEGVQRVMVYHQYPEGEGVQRVMVYYQYPEGEGVQSIHRVTVYYQYPEGEGVQRVTVYYHSNYQLACTVSLKGHNFSSDSPIKHDFLKTGEAFQMMCSN